MSCNETAGRARRIRRVGQADRASKGISHGIRILVGRRYLHVGHPACGWRGFWEISGSLDQPLVPPYARRRAFTLIELTVVVALVALVMGVALVKLRGPIRIAQAQAAVEQLALFEQQSRHHAKRFGRSGELQIDLKKGRFRLLDTGQGKLRPRQLALGRAARIERVYTAGKQRTNGVVKVPLSRRGQTETYAIRLRGADDKPRWMLFVGLSGQLVQIDDEDEFRELRKVLLSAARPDAD